MSPEAQRIAIAKSVGIHLHDGDHAPSNYVFATDLPDYLNDLNAMHEVEESLGGSTDYKWSGYCTHLLDVCGEMGSRIHATAAQRAEAYLRTIGKWEGGSR
jgi:hypothetical protein